MNCERWQSELSDRAAGAALSTALEAHLSGCASCRARLAAELALFSGIDSGLQALANQEVPAHLTASIRQRLASEPRSSGTWNPVWIPAAAALMAALALVLLPSKPARQRPQPTERAAAGSAERPAAVTPRAPVREPSPEPGRPVRRETTPAPAVAFLPDRERAAIAHLVEGLASGEIPSGVLEKPAADGVREISIPPLSVEALEVKPLSRLAPEAAEIEPVVEN